MPARSRRAPQAGKTLPSAGRSVVASSAKSGIKLEKTQKYTKEISASSVALVSFVFFVVNGLRHAEEISHPAMLYSTQQLWPNHFPNYAFSERRGEGCVPIQAEAKP